LKIFESFRERKVALMEEDFLYWGMAYFEKGDFKEASYYFNLPQKPIVEDLYHYAGKAYFKMNKIPEALQKLDSAIVLLRAKDGTGVETELSSPVYYDRAIVYHKAGKKRDAESDFLHACYLTPEIVAQKDYESNPISLLDDAVKLLKISKKAIDSTRLKGYQDRAETLMLSGETNRAWAEIKKCEQVDSTHSRNSLLRAKVSAILGKFADGLIYLDKAEKQPNGKSEEEIAYYRAVIYHERGESLKAKEAIDKAIKLRPTEANYLSLLASIEFDTPNIKGALEAIQKALKMQPQNLDYILERAIYQYANDNFEETIKDCNRVIEQESDNAEAFYQRGLAYRATKRYKEALLDFQKAEQYHNDEPELKELIREMKGK
jgi:tetratricopeptide (TPR) repeat protein